MSPPQEPVGASRSRSGKSAQAFDLVIVGAGQAGLAMSRELARRGLEHVVLERGRVGETWRGRWESFCLVTPNWSMQPGGWVIAERHRTGS
jgi:cation diffusion facilitator CzcD-associated flavoprotein CzcO